MELPQWDTKPTNPFYGPLSAYLLGDNPLDPLPHPESLKELAEGLGVTAAKLQQIRSTKGFRKFHSDHTSNLDEVVQRRQEMLDTLYASGMAGSVQGAVAFLNATKQAEALAKAGQIDTRELSVADAADLTDEQLAEFLETQNKDHQ